jgi:hypothetical protein
MITAVSAAALERKDLIIKLAPAFGLSVYLPYCAVRMPASEMSAATRILEQLIAAK